MTLWMKHAWSLVDQAEIPGPASNPAIAQMFADAGVPEITRDETHWCGAFVGACLARAGLPGPMRYEALRARAYAKIGTPIDVARVGAIAVFERGSNPEHGHVGFVTGETPTHLMLLGGNQSNAVNVMPFPKDRLVALRWPEVVEKAAASRTDAQAETIADDAVKLAAGEALVHSGAKITKDFGWLETLSAKAGKLQGSLEGLTGFAGFLVEKPWTVGILLLVFFGARFVRSGSIIRGLRLQDQNSGAHVNRDNEERLALNQE